MHLVVPSFAGSVALIAAGLISVGPSALPDIDIPVLQLTAGESALDTSTDLLNSAITNLTDGIDILSPDAADNVDLARELGFQTSALDLLNLLQSNEDLISTHLGSLSGLVDQLFFIPLDQQWVATTEALLQGDQALDAAIASGSGLEAAELAMFGPDFQLVSDLLGSLPVVLASMFFL